jgi:hypothetical protein
MTPRTGIRTTHFGVFDRVDGKKMDTGRVGVLGKGKCVLRCCFATFVEEALYIRTVTPWPEKVKRILRASPRLSTYRQSLGGVSKPVVVHVVQ